MSNIKCSCCGKDSNIELISDSIGTSYARVKRIGWTVKNSMFINKQNDWYSYCSKECLSAHWQPIIEEYTSCNIPK